MSGSERIMISSMPVLGNNDFWKILTFGDLVDVVEDIVWTSNGECSSFAEIVLHVYNYQGLHSYKIYAPFNL